MLPKNIVSLSSFLDKIIRAYVEYYRVCLGVELYVLCTMVCFFLFPIPTKSMCPQFLVQARSGKLSVFSR
jgi:hypothetical protein